MYRGVGKGGGDGADDTSFWVANLIHLLCKVLGERSVQLESFFLF